MSHYGRKNNNAVSQTLAGKDSQGMPLSGHRHVFYIPTDDDNDGCLDHITIMTDTGLNETELGAINAVNEIHSGSDNIHARIRPSNHDTANQVTRKHKIWIAKTPFVLNRHTKIRGKKMIDTPKSQVALELERRYTSYKVSNITIMENNIPMCISKKLPKEFKRTRKPGEVPMSGYEAIIEFMMPISGPLFLGYGCHFGLGMFVPYDGDEYGQYGA